MSSAGNFTLTKTCESNLLCTVESSNLDAIPAGTPITYRYDGDGSDGLAPWLPHSPRMIVMWRSVG